MGRIVTVLLVFGCMWGVFHAADTLNRLKLEYAAAPTRGPASSSPPVSDPCTNARSCLGL